MTDLTRKLRQIAVLIWLTSSLAAMGFQGPALEERNPGPEHQWLKSFAGDWEMDISVWPQPQTEPLKYQARAQHQMKLGDRYLHMQSKGEMGPITIESLMILGFDRRMEKFTLMGFDSMGTYSISAAGSWAKPEEVIVFEGVDQHPKTEAKNRFRFKLTKQSPDHFVLVLHFLLPDGGEHQVAEMTYRRAS